MTPLSPETLSIAISHPIHVTEAQRAALHLALFLGFDPPPAYRWALAVTELATNILHYAQQGQIHLQTVRRAGKIGIAVTAQDHGPGIADLAFALSPGSSTAQSLGYGLSAVQREVLMNWTSVPHSTPAPASGDVNGCLMGLPLFLQKHRSTLLSLPRRVEKRNEVKGPVRQRPTFLPLSLSRREGKYRISPAHVRPNREGTLPCPLQRILTTVW